MTKKVALWLGAFVTGVALIVVFNLVAFQRPLNKVLRDDPRNNGVSAIAHAQWFLNPTVLVFDLRGMDPTNSRLDVMRVLLEYSQTQTDRSYTRVVLAYRGTPKFLISGEFFRTTGTEYGSQNPMYTLRTFPQNVENLDQSPAFETWTGGLIGVLGKQMDDLATFNDRWYLAEIRTHQEARIGDTAVAPNPTSNDGL
jgi:hypothetical protein